MATVWAVNNGNWSSAATWSGSYIPQPGDDVFANNRTVNVDTSFDVASLRNTSGTGITAGGTFNFNSGSISGSITGATPISAGASNVLTVSHNTGLVQLTLINATNSPSSINTPFMLHSGGGTLIITVPTITVTTAGFAGTKRYIDKTGNGDLTINGDLTLAGGGDQASPSVVVSQAGNVFINGNISAGSFNFSNTSGVRPVLVTGGNLTIVGNIVGPQVSIASGFIRTVDFTGTNFVFTGSISGGSVSSAGIGVVASATNISISGSITGNVGPALSVTSAATISVVGSIIAGPSIQAISLSGASTFIYSGSLASSAGSPAIVSTNASATNIFTGPFVNTNNTMAVQCVDMVLTQDASTFWNFGNTTLFSPERLAFYPSASDIRQGTTYADGTVSGSLAMPPPTAVIAGTPTDNTTGSAVLTPTQLQDAVWGRDLAQMTETGSIGYRLAKSATTDSTGKQIASYLI